MSHLCCGLVVLTHTHTARPWERQQLQVLPPLSALSETQNQFAASDTKGWGHDATPTQTGGEEKGIQAQNMSKVFRSGDYNITGEDPSERFQSIQMKDYLPAQPKADIHGTGGLAFVSCLLGNAPMQLCPSLSPSLMSTGAFTGRDYQTSTHFKVCVHVPSVRPQ